MKKSFYFVTTAIFAVFLVATAVLAPTKVQAQTINGNCGLQIKSLAPNSAVSFPLTITGIIDNSNRSGCTWGMFEGTAGEAQLYFNSHNVGWEKIGMGTPVYVSHWTATTTNFKVTMEFKNDRIGLPAGTPMKIMFVEESPSGLGTPDSYGLPITYSVSGPVTNVPSCYTFTRNLGIGDQNEEVTKLIRILVKEGFLNSDEMFQDGRTVLNINEEVAAAIVKLQGKYGISQTGYFGPITRAKVNSLYACVTPSPSVSPTPVPSPRYPAPCYTFMTNIGVGSSGADVVALQTLLIAKGFIIKDIVSGQSPRGYFGESTAAAVIKYQASAGIPSTGFVGPLTRASLNGLCTGTTPTSPRPLIKVLNPKNGDVWVQNNAYTVSFVPVVGDFDQYSIRLANKVVPSTEGGGPIFQSISKDKGGNPMEVTFDPRDLSQNLINAWLANARSSGDYTVTEAQIRNNFYFHIVAQKNSTTGKDGPMFAEGKSEIFSIMSDKGPTPVTKTPSIISVAGKAAGNFEIDAGGMVGINGTNFLSEKGSPQVDVYIGDNDLKCNIIQISDTLIYCTAPSILTVGGTYSLRVVNSFGSSNVVRVKVLGNVNPYPTTLGVNIRLDSLSPLGPITAGNNSVNLFIFDISSSAKDVQLNGFVVGGNDGKLSEKLSAVYLYIGSTLLSTGTWDAVNGFYNFNAPIQIPAYTTKTFRIAGNIRPNVTGSIRMMLGGILHNYGINELNVVGLGLYSNLLMISPSPTPSVTPSPSPTVPIITVLSPNGGEVINNVQGSDPYLTVSFIPVANQRVYINLADSTSAHDLISYNNYYHKNISDPYYGISAERQSILLYLPKDWINVHGTQYKIEICSANQCDKSNNYFTVSTATAANQPPVVSGGTFPSQLKVNEIGTWTLQASDPENGPLSYSVNWGDNSVGATSLAQTTTYTHSYSIAGTYTVMFTVRDNAGLSAQTSATVSVIAPVTPVVVCPVGYICTPPGSTNYCPAGYTCTNMTTNCPSGYTCKTYAPTPSPSVSPSPTASPSPTPYTSPAPSATPSPRPTSSPSPSPSSTPSPSASPVRTSMTDQESLSASIWDAINDYFRSGGY